MSGAASLVILAAFAVGPAPARAAGQEPAGPTVIELAGAYGPPDGTVTVPIDLRAPDDVSVGDIELSLSIPAAAVAFERAALSGISEAAGVSLTVEARPVDASGNVVVRLTLRGREEGPSRQPVPTGQIAHLVFKISDKAAPNSGITLAPKVTARTTDSPPAAIEPVESPESQIAVTSPAVISCFFYLH